MNFYENILLFFRHILFLFQKEWLVTIKDPRMRVMLIMPAIIQGFLFGYVANYNLENVPFALVDESHGQWARDYAAHLSGAPSFQLEAVRDNPAEIADMIYSGRIMAAVVIPSDFERKLARGETAPVEVIADGRNNVMAGMAVNYISKITEAWNQEHTGRQGPVTVESRTWYNPNQLTRWNFLPGLIAMISFVQVILLSGLSIAREREQGTMEQLLVTPLSSMEILIGKAMPPVIVGFSQSMMLYLISRYWFEVPFSGSLLSLAAVIFTFMMSSSGIGLSISSISKNMQQVLVYVVVFMVPMTLLSGVTTPVENMPPLLQWITYVDPMRFAVDAVRRIYLEGALLYDVRADIFFMMLIASITLPTAAYLFRHHSS